MIAPPTPVPRVSKTMLLQLPAAADPKLAVSGRRGVVRVRHRQPASRLRRSPIGKFHQPGKLTGAAAAHLRIHAAGHSQAGRGNLGPCKPASPIAWPTAAAIRPTAASGPAPTSVGMLTATQAAAQVVDHAHLDVRAAHVHAHEKRGLGSRRRKPTYE